MSYLFNIEHVGVAAHFVFIFFKVKFFPEGSVSTVVLNIQHPFKTSMNVVQSDDCQNVLLKLNTQ